MGTESFVLLFVVAAAVAVADRRLRLLYTVARACSAQLMRGWPRSTQHLCPIARARSHRSPHRIAPYGAGSGVQSRCALNPFLGRHPQQGLVCLDGDTGTVVLGTDRSAARKQTNAFRTWRTTRRSQRRSTTRLRWSVRERTESVSSKAWSECHRTRWVSAGERALLRRGMLVRVSAAQAR